MSSAGVDGLPDRPLPIEVVQRLEGHDRIECLHPIYTLGEGPYPRWLTFTLYLTSGAGFLLCLDPEFETWRSIANATGEHDDVMQSLEDAANEEISEQWYGEASAYLWGDGDPELFEVFEP